MTNSAAEGELRIPEAISANADAYSDGVSAGADPDLWRAEVAARLARYRTRRKPRAPRYPSLMLPFDAPESRSGTLSSSSIPRAFVEEPAGGDSAADDFLAPVCGMAEEAATAPPLEPFAEPDFSAKVIEFPRSAAIPVFEASPLADPIFEKPRIVEAPEVVPPPPALGGILIEPEQKEPAERRAGADLLARASIRRRLAAGTVDGLILAAALAAFAGIFLRLNPVRGPVPLLAGVAASLLVLLWMTYQFLFTVLTGATPGLRAVRLRIARFDGSVVGRRIRRWRVLASFLSAFSAGLGYLWCLLDADSLCWHDRITRTYLRSIPPARKNQNPPANPTP